MMVTNKLQHEGIYVPMQHRGLGRTMCMSRSEGRVNSRTVIAMLFVAAVSMLISGCSSNDNSDLTQKLNEIKARPAGKIPGLPVFKRYEKYLYSASAEQDPFKYIGGSTEPVPDDGGKAPAAPEIRNPEALEEYPLDTLRYVGQMAMEGRDWAIITSPDMIVHRVKAGNYLGQNYGKIVAIQEDKILITEKTFDDFLNKWIERDAALSLSE